MGRKLNWRKSIKLDFKNYRELMFGQMVDNMMVHGRQTTCMVKEYILGKMEEGMKGSISMIKNMALDLIYGLMGGNT